MLDTHQIKSKFELLDEIKSLKSEMSFLYELFSIISHDLKNPMGALDNYIELILLDFETASKESMKNDLSDVRNITKSTLNLIDNLFNWAWLQTDRLEVMPDKINISQLVNENIQVCELQAKNKKIKISNNINSTIEAFADQNMVKTILRNLLGNAIKFTNVNGNINIDAKKDGEEIIVKVEDEGVGIAPENLQKIFINNHDSMKMGTNNEKGTGLGLLICKEFVEKNNGRIWVESELNKGAKFYFTIPQNI